MKTSVTWTQMFLVFGRIGLLSFGGPAAQIALMHRELVEERTWLQDAVFLRALSLCMLLPGPEAMQLATYAGWRLRGVMGGLVAGLLFVLPGATVILLLALLYGTYGTLPLVQAAFTGIKAAVIVIVVQALVRLRTKAASTPAAAALAVGAFLGLFVFDLPYPLVVMTAAGMGALWMQSPPPQMTTTAATSAEPLRTIAIWGMIWAAPVVLIAMLDTSFLMQVALFFSKLAVVTFGGAYAVLAYMTQTVVADFGWITTEQMVDALGLAETTPGPLILVTQFVAMIAGFAQGGPVLALAAGATALWVTFVPCFLWIFLAGPYLDQIAARPSLAAALQGVTAAVVGVIFNLALWFAIHVLFLKTRQVAGIAAPLPDLSAPDVGTIALTCLAAILLMWMKRGIAETLAILAGAGLLAGLI